jgi:hypothetical protein
MDLEAVAMTKPRDLTELPAVESRALSARNVISVQVPLEYSPLSSRAAARIAGLHQPLDTQGFPELASPVRFTQLAGSIRAAPPDRS